MVQDSTQSSTCSAFIDWSMQKMRLICNSLLVNAITVFGNVTEGRKAGACYRANRYLSRTCFLHLRNRSACLQYITIL